jgi:hypothetical protein
MKNSQQQTNNKPTLIDKKIRHTRGFSTKNNLIRKDKIKAP